VYATDTYVTNKKKIY